MSGSTANAQRKNVSEIGEISRQQCHFGEHADAESSAYIRLDQVRVARGDRDSRQQPGAEERAAQRRVGLERRLVTDQGIFRELIEARRLVELREGMIARNQYMTVPAEQRYGHATGGHAAGRRYDRDISLAAFQQRKHFGVAARLQVDTDLGIATLQAGDGTRQHETCLGMGGCDAQLALGFVAKIGGQGANVGGFSQDHAGAIDDLHTGGSDAFETLAFAREDLETEFVFQLLQLLGDAGLGRVDALGGESDVQAGIGDGDQIAELCECHDGLLWGDRNSSDASERRQLAFTWFIQNRMA